MKTVFDKIREYYNYSEMKLEFLIEFRDKIISQNKSLEKELINVWEIPSNDYQFEGWCI